MSLRLRRRLLRGVCHASILLLLTLAMSWAQAVGDDGGMRAWAGLSLLWLLTFRINPLPGIVSVWLFRQTTCGECGEAMDLVNYWRCGCGYVTWQPRHAFSPCPHCRKVFRWLVCPRCGASISF